MATMLRYAVDVVGGRLGGKSSIVMQLISPEPGRYAYSYLRFSSPDQMTGDSVRRQTSLATAYAAEFGLTLDDHLTYQDFGISSFRGQNATSGRLGDFLAAVSAGIVPQGSLLLVENLDRLSRESALHAQNLLTQIVLAGVTIVTLSDRRTYSIDELRRDPMGLIYALINFIRANEESELKSFRGRASWGAKRAIAASKPITASCPRWLELDKAANRFVTIPKRVRIVRKIFASIAKGETQAGIAKKLNRNKVPTWQEGGLWTRDKIGWIIRCSAVIGTFVPHRIEWEDGRQIRRPCEPIRDYYPAIISVEAFERVQTDRLASNWAGHGLVGNLLSHLAVCSTCGSAMVIMRWTPNGPSLICSASAAGTTAHYSPVTYGIIEATLRRDLPSLLRDYGVPNARFGRSNRLWAAQNSVDRARRDCAALDRATFVTGDPDEAWDALDAAEDELQDAVESYQQHSTRTLTKRITVALECLERPEWRDDEAIQVNRAMRAVFAKARVDTSNGMIELHQLDGAIHRLDFTPHGAKAASTPY